MRWADLEAGAPALGELGRHRLIDPGVLIVVTVRRDGTPRLSPVEPFVLDGELWLSMMWRSLKALDLLRDPRVLVHSVVTSPEGKDGEMKVRGRAIPERDLVRRAAYCQAVAILGWQPEEPYFHLFRLDIADVTYIRYATNGDQYVARWPPAQEYIRRATSPTSVGDPEDVTDLFHAD
jgi:hypothetical protein